MAGTDNYRGGESRPPGGGLLLVALLPSVALAIVGGGTGQWRLGGVAVALAVLGGMLAGQQSKKANSSHRAAVILLYLVAVAATWWVPAAEATASLARGLLLLTGAIGWTVWELQHSGAEPLRRAWAAARAVQRRGQWPPQLEECLHMPEVVRLRQVVQGQQEVRPILPLLVSPRPPVQLAALHALAYRSGWYAGEAEYVLQAAGTSPHVPIRMALVQALANVQGVELLSALTGFLRDPAPEVRDQATAVLLWRAEQRWPLIRESIRDVLADPLYPLDGPLFSHFDPAAGVRLPGAAIADLITWAAEPPPLAPRAILTLIAHFRAELMAGLQPELTAELAELMLHPDTPPALRVELAALLRDLDLLSPELLDRLTNVDQPAPMRLFAAEMMLRINPHDPDGIDVLRGLARQSNRELAIQVALILQNYLGLDFGLDPHNPPAPNSKAAAELTRRLFQWANQCHTDPLGEASSDAGSCLHPARLSNDPGHSIHHPPLQTALPSSPTALPDPDGLEESHFIPLEHVLGDGSSSNTSPPAAPLTPS